MEYYSKDRVVELVDNLPNGKRLILACKNGVVVGAKSIHADMKAVNIQMHPIVEISRILNEKFWGDILVDKLGGVIIYIGSEPTYKP